MDKQPYIIITDDDPDIDEVHAAPLPGVVNPVWRYFRKTLPRFVSLPERIDHEPLAVGSIVISVDLPHAPAEPPVDDVTPAPHPTTNTVRGPG